MEVDESRKYAVPSLDVPQDWALPSAVHDKAPSAQAAQVDVAGA